MAIKTKPMYPSQEDLLRAILTIPAKMNLIMWLYIRPSNLRLLRLLHWSVFDLIWLLIIYIYILSRLVRRPHSNHPSSLVFLPTYLWCRRFDRLGGRWNRLDILVCNFSRYIPALGEPTGLVADHERHLQSAFSTIYSVMQFILLIRFQLRRIFLLRVAANMLRLMVVHILHEIPFASRNFRYSKPWLEFSSLIYALLHSQFGGWLAFSKEIHSQIFVNASHSPVMNKQIDHRPFNRSCDFG